MRLLLFVLFVSFVVKHDAARAAEPFLKPNDVIAFVGGEDMVVAAELGYLETLLQRALPGHKLKFRSLAWEGDTVFEQRRDLNYPTLETQLDKIGATVVLCQFGQMESLAGKEKLPDFIAAYEKSIARLSGGGKRRVAMISPNEYSMYLKATKKMRPDFLWADNPPKNLENWEVLLDYKNAAADLAKARFGTQPEGVEFKPGLFFIDLSKGMTFDSIIHRDGLHLTSHGQEINAVGLADELADVEETSKYLKSIGDLRALVTAKNRLWFNYYRPQNWAFLAGDRTTQPSSRDHLDPKKRWFPDELEQFLPLIEAKEKEIWALAEKLAKEGGGK